MKTPHEKLFDEITELIKANLEVLYNYEEDSLINIKKYCKEIAHKKYKPLKYKDLIFFTEEALAELINTPYLFDFRSLD